MAILWTLLSNDPVAERVYRVDVVLLAIRVLDELLVESGGYNTTVIRPAPISKAVVMAMVVVCCNK